MHLKYRQLMNELMYSEKCHENNIWVNTDVYKLSSLIDRLAHFPEKLQFFWFLIFIAFKKSHVLVIAIWINWKT